MQNSYLGKFQREIRTILMPHRSFRFIVLRILLFAKDKITVHANVLSRGLIDHRTFYCIEIGIISVRIVRQDQLYRNA